jgi:hypothetical protein
VPPLCSIVASAPRILCARFLIAHCGSLAGYRTAALLSQ